MPTLEVIDLPDTPVPSDGIQLLADITEHPPKLWYPIYNQVNHRPNLVVLEAIYTSTDEDDEREYRLLFEIGRLVVNVSPAVLDHRFAISQLISLSPLYPKILEYMKTAARASVDNNSKGKGAKAVLHDWHVFNPQ